MTSIPHLVALGLAVALLTHLLMPPVRRLGMALGLVDHPSWRRAQKEAVPCSGGLAIYAAVVITSLAMAVLVELPFAGRALVALGLSGLGTLVLGVLDDRFGLHAEKKLLGQIVVVTLPMASGLTLNALHLPGVGTVELGLLAGPVTLFWYLGFINSMNLIDGLDGLAGGISVIVLGALGLAVAPSDPVGLLFVVVALGAGVGFLRSNLSGRRIFLGDAGSMLLGLWLAGLSLGLARRTPELPLVAVVAMAVPILDTATTILRRRRRGVSVFRADDEHLHHRLLRLGMTPRRATASLWFASIAAGCVGSLVVGRPSASILALGAVAAVSIELAYTLPRHGRPTVGEAVGYILGTRDQLVADEPRRELAEIIEMPRFRPEPWSPTTPVAPPVAPAPEPEAAAGELRAARAEEGGKTRDDVLLALGEDNR